MLLYKRLLFLRSCHWFYPHMTRLVSLYDNVICQRSCFFLLSATQEFIQCYHKHCLGLFSSPLSHWSNKTHCQCSRTQMDEAVLFLQPGIPVCFTFICLCCLFQVIKCQNFVLVQGSKYMWTCLPSCSELCHLWVIFTDIKGHHSLVMWSEFKFHQHIPCEISFKKQPS